MSYEIEGGKTYKASETKPCRIGEAQSRGTWRMVTICSDEGKDEQALFVRNEDCGLVDGKYIASFKVDKIISVTRARRNVGGKWLSSLTINVEGHATDEEPKRVLTDGELPF